MGLSQAGQFLLVLHILWRHHSQQSISRVTNLKGAGSLILGNIFFTPKLLGVHPFMGSLSSIHQPNLLVLPPHAPCLLPELTLNKAQRECPCLCFLFSLPWHPRFWNSLTGTVARMSFPQLSSHSWWCLPAPTCSRSAAHKLAHPEANYAVLELSSFFSPQSLPSQGSFTSCFYSVSCSYRYELVWAKILKNYQNCT